jgi:squalene-associated FAD-dependent desaturase
MKIAIVGGGWAGLTAAVTATQAGHHATLFEAACALGGRARALEGTLPDGRKVTLDNGQHILIGAYTECLKLMRTVGVNTDTALLRLPLTLQFPDGQGLKLPNWPSPLDVLVGIVSARGWSAADKWSLLRTAARWQMQGFRCSTETTVEELGRSLRPAVRSTLIDPLCVSALNTPAHQASGEVFLTVLHDSLMAGTGASNLLLPRVDLGALFADAAAQWLKQRGAVVHTGHRVVRMEQAPQGWQVEGEAFDAVVWATSATNAAQSLTECAREAPESIANQLTCWAATAAQLAFEPIATVYAYAPGVCLPQPLLALRSDDTSPAQFAFDRGKLGGPQGLLALVVSASHGERAAVQTQVLRQAHLQLAPWLAGQTLQVVQTVVEKRATFACTPALCRPPAVIAPSLAACGDYIAGPYPATLEGAVRSGLNAIKILETA